jgi:hypothetical protein
MRRHTSPVARRHGPSRHARESVDRLFVVVVTVRRRCQPLRVRGRRARGWRLHSGLWTHSLTDGSEQRPTNNRDDEGGVFWLPGGQSILFYRWSPQYRIATVDVGKLMAGK